MANSELESTGSNTALSKRIYNILDLRLENDKETLEALKELSTFFPDNTAENRRNLRSVIEKRTLGINNEFLQSLKKVESTLDNIYKDVSEMNNSVTEMRNRLSSTKVKTRTLIDQTTKLQKDVKSAAAKKQLASAFIEKFQLNPSELTSLRSATVSPDMFVALEKTQEILNNCNILLQAGCQVAAQDIMEQMTLYQETGLERLFRWAQGRCRTIEAPDPYNLLPQAMAKLQHRAELFNQILEEYATNRRNILVRQFIDALTAGGRPIELRATEPKRYVGDILAWLHQAIPAERDNLNYLLKCCENIDTFETVQQTLGSISEGVCHPLKVRIEHILLNEDQARDCVLLHDVFNLLIYYRNIIAQVVGSSQMDSTMSELVDVAQKTFLLALQNRVSFLLGTEIETPPGDLLPTPSANKVLSLLGQLLSSDSSPEGKQNHISQMVSCAIDPLLIHVTESASKLAAVEMSVYLLNNFHFIETSLALYPFLDDRLERLKAQCDAQMDTLTSEQASTLVAHLSLGPIYTILQGHPTKPMSSIPAMSPSNISNFAGKLETLLATPDIYQLPQLALLASANQRSGIQKRAASVIASIYTSLYQAVNDSENMYQNPSQLLPKSPQTVTQILTTGNQ